jgi:hypothetical protein
MKYLRNWKTSLIGIATMALQLAHFYPPAVPYIAPVTSILVAAGFVVAHDATVPTAP